MRYALATANDFGYAFTIENTSGYEYVGESNAIAVDTARNYYIAGTIVGSGDFDPGPGVVQVSGNNLGAGFIAKYNAEGSLLWVRKFAGNERVFIKDIALTPSNGVVATGAFQGTADFDPGAGVQNRVALGANDLFAVTLDANGGFQSVLQLGGADASVFGNGVAVDSSGAIYLTGGSSGTIDFDPGSGVQSYASNASNGYVAKFTAQGAFVYSAHFSGSLNEGHKVAVDAAGNAYMAGVLTGTADYDPSPASQSLTANGPSDAIILKLNSAGQLAYVKRVSGDQGDSGFDIQVDPRGFVYAVGAFTGAADIDPGPSTLIRGGAGSNSFILKLDATDGDTVFAKDFSADVGRSCDARAIALDGDGNLYLTGSASGAVDFDPGPDVLSYGPGYGGAYAVKLDGSGNFRYVVRLGPGVPSTSFAFAIAVDNVGNALIFGTFQGPVDFDPGYKVQTFSTPHGSQLFVSQLIPSYFENAGPTPFANTIIAASENFRRLQVTISANGSVADLLGLQNQGTGAGQIGLSGTDVLYGGVKIGSYTGGASLNPLVVYLEPSQATPAAVEALIKAVTFRNTSDAIYAARRTIQFQTTSASDDVTTPLTQPLPVVPINDAPTLTAPASAQVPKNGSVTFSTAGGNSIALADPDIGGQTGLLIIKGFKATLSTTAGLTFLKGTNGDAEIRVKGSFAALNAALNGVSLAPPTNYVGSGKQTITVSDYGGVGDGGEIRVTRTININVFDPAVTVLTIGDSSYSHSGAWSASGLTGFNGSASEYSNATAATATWTPTLAAGTYRVEFYKIVSSGNATAAQLKIHHNGADSVVPLNLATGSDGFVNFGNFTFSGSGDEFLQLARASGGGYLRANAVRLTKIA